MKSFPNIVPNGAAFSRLRDQMSRSQLTTLRTFHITWHSTFCTSLLSAGVYVIGFSYPVVPKGKARIRVQISAAHTDEDIDHCVDAFIQTGRKHGVISWAGIRRIQRSAWIAERRSIACSCGSFSLLPRRPMSDVDGKISYIIRPAEMNVIVVC